MENSADTKKNSSPTQLITAEKEEEKNLIIWNMQIPIH